MSNKVILTKIGKTPVHKYARQIYNIQVVNSFVDSASAHGLVFGSWAQAHLEPGDVSTV